MAEGIHARLTAAQGRRFGLTLGAAFLVLAGILWWRDLSMASRLLAVAGAALAIAGLLVPTHLGPVERAWMALAHAISKVTTPIVMGLMYLLVVTPIGFLRRAFGGNPLVHAEHQKSYWHGRPEGARRSKNLARQF